MYIYIERDSYIYAYTYIVIYPLTLSGIGTRPAPHRRVSGRVTRAGIRARARTSAA